MGGSFKEPPVCFEACAGSTVTNVNRLLSSSRLSMEPAMPSTVRIGPEVFIFLKQLKKNNNREWFQKNKDRYDPTRPPHPRVGQSPPNGSAVTCDPSGSGTFPG